jgi:hypothetical protein
MQHAPRSTVRPFYSCNSFGWTLWIDSRKLSTWDRSTYNHANASDILQHWSNCCNRPFQLNRSIYWEAREYAIKRLGLNKVLWILKWLAGCAPIGKVLQRFQFQDHAKCLRCSKFEDTTHVVQCKAPQTISQWEALISKLDQGFIKAIRPCKWRIVESRTACIPLGTCLIGCIDCP